MPGKVKIPVAIRVLNRDIRLSQNSEFLQEDSIWASVDHENCVSILAICTTQGMKIITPLMLFGSLRDYILKERENIDSQVMLKWCKQIARVGDSS